MRAEVILGRGHEFETAVLHGRWTRCRRRSFYGMWLGRTTPRRSCCCDIAELRSRLLPRSNICSRRFRDYSQYLVRTRSVRRLADRLVGCLPHLHRLQARGLSCGRAGAEKVSGPATIFELERGYELTNDRFSTGNQVLSSPGQKGRWLVPQSGYREMPKHALCVIFDNNNIHEAYWQCRVPN